VHAAERLAEKAREYEVLAASHTERAPLGATGEHAAARRLPPYRLGTSGSSSSTRTDPGAAVPAAGPTAALVVAPLPAGRRPSPSEARGTREAG